MKMKKHHYLGGVICIAVLAGAYAFTITRPEYLAETDLAARNSERSPTVNVGNVQFRVTLARTESEREKGLMYITKLHDDEGMLFIFERKAAQTFWNKNTKLALKVIWISEDKVIGVSDLPSDDEGTRLVASPAAVTHVLEVAQTSSLARDIKIGDSVRINE
jgi:uncharacterized membrane protein (UPF0127 family)